MEFRENQAIYLQIAELICERILLKQWASEDKVPSVRELAVQLEVNPNTVMRTYDFLEQKDIIFTKRGMGFFVSANAHDKVTQYRREEFYKMNYLSSSKPFTYWESTFQNYKIDLKLLKPKIINP
jgi:DNA-binding transcriptional regulator YhcF (GntR family)